MQESIDHTKYRDRLVSMIKASGQELIDRAESFVANDMELISDYDISIHFPADDSFPYITLSMETPIKNVMKIYINNN